VHELPPPRLRRLSSREAWLFFVQLGDLLQAGIGARAALEELSEQAGSRRVRRAAGQAAEGVQEGQSLAGALEAAAGAFEPRAVAMVRAGEAAGAVAETCHLLAQWHERELAMARRMAWPRLWYGAIGLFALVAVSFVGYALNSVTDDVHANIAHMIRYPIWALEHLVPWVLSGFLALWLIRKALARAPAGLRDRVALIVPWAGNVRRSWALQSFACVMQMGARAGLPIATALDLAAAATGNVALQRSVEAVRRRLDRGASLTEALAASRLLETPALGLVRTGEHAGTLEANWGRVAAEYEAKGQQAAAKLMGVSIAAAAVWSGVVVIAAAACGYVVYAEAVMKAVHDALH